MRAAVAIITMVATVLHLAVGCCGHVVPCGGHADAAHPGLEGRGEERPGVAARLPRVACCGAAAAVTVAASCCRAEATPAGVGVDAGALDDAVARAVPAAPDSDCDSTRHDDHRVTHSGHDCDGCTCVAKSETSEADPAHDLLTRQPPTAAGIDAIARLQAARGPCVGGPPPVPSTARPALFERLVV